MINKLIVIILILLLFNISYCKLTENFYIKYTYNPFHKQSTKPVDEDKVVSTKDNNLKNYEYKMLEKLHNNYKCSCGSKRRHFPTPIIKFGKYTYIMSSCGKSFNKIYKKVEIIDRDKQVKCIIKNFQNNNIYYKDMVSGGRNLCYKDGVIAVIDMDIAMCLL